VYSFKSTVAEQPHLASAAVATARAWMNDCGDRNVAMLTPALLEQVAVPPDHYRRLPTERQSNADTIWHSILVVVHSIPSHILRNMQMVWQDKKTPAIMQDSIPLTCQLGPDGHFATMNTNTG
jgi:hypothetical protein